jgi:outer membrane protein, heavy metal efflux system
MAPNPTVPRGAVTAFSALALLLAGCVRYEARPLVPGQSAAAIGARSLTSPDLRQYLADTAGRDVAAWPPETWDFETLAWVAFRNHPGLDIARAHWDVVRGGVRTAAGRPNPTVTATPGYAFGTAAGLSPWIPGIAFDVPVETAGKRGKRIAQGRLLAEAERLNVVTAAWQVRGDLRRALLELATANRRVALQQDLVSLQREMAALLEERRQAGAAASTEVFPARIALAKAEAEAGVADRQAIAARVRLAQALGLPLRALEGHRFANPADIAVPDRSPEVLAMARRTCLQTRADILSALAAYEASQSALQLEVARQYPDLHLGSGYQWDQGTDKWNLSIALELPLLNRNQGPIAEAGARRREAAARFVATQVRVNADLDAAVAERSLAVGQLAALEAVDAQLLQRAERVRKQFEAGGADRLEDRGAQLELAQGRLTLLDARHQAALAAGQLEDVLQVPFARLAVVEATPSVQSPFPTP